MRIVPSTTEDDSYLPASWRMLTALLHYPALTQAELRHHTGLSHPVIVKQVAALRATGLLTNGKPLYGHPGRPRIPLTFNWDFRRVLAVDVHPAGLTARAMNLAGESQGPSHPTAVPDWSADGLHKELERLIARMLRHPGAPWAGIGIVLPGGVSPDGQTLLTCAGMPNCAPDPLASALSTRFHLPVLLESTGYALARGIWARQQTPPTSLMAFSLRHSPRVGMGLLIDGQRVPGNVRDCSGLGMVRADGNGKLTGGTHDTCLQALLAAARDDNALRPQAIHALGVVAAHLVSAMSPDHLALQGDARWSEQDTAEFQSTLTEHASPAVVNSLTVGAHPAQPTECLDGITNLLVNRLLDFRQGVIASWLE